MAQTQAAAAGSRDTATNEVFVARQPIFDRQNEVVAYELLFRGSRANHYTGTDADSASFTTLNNALHLIGLDALTGGRRAFINFTRRLLIEEAYTLLPPSIGVIELLENVEPDKPVVDACRRAKEAGYTLALDDFVFGEQYRELLTLADIVKIDYLNTSEAERERWGKLAQHYNVDLLAEKVETHETLQHAHRFGYSLFQGYFFCRPEVHEAVDLQAGHNSYLRFLQELNTPELDYDRLEEVIKQDTSLCYKLLRYLNSAALGLRQKVTSIHQGLALMGEQPLRKWGSLVALTGLAENKPAELITSCLVRARFCEQLADATSQGHRRDELFIMGLVSRLNAVMNRPIRELLEQLPLEDEVRDALLGRRTGLGRIYNLVRACERGDWDRVIALSDQLELDHDHVAHQYRQALEWADQVFGRAATTP
jgi:EAL and modified HD-GYP domain-containing signal transduction protein